MRVTAPAQRPVRSQPSTRPRSSRWPWLLPLIAGVLVLGGLIVVLSQSEPRLAGSNDVRMVGYPIEIPPGDRFCQSGERVPPDAARMQLQAGAEGRPGPRLLVTVNRRMVQVPGGYRDGPLDVELTGPGAPNATVCVENRGGRRVFLGGQAVSLAIPPGLSATLDGAPLDAAATVQYWRAGEESGWAIAGAVLDRWSRVTAFGGATPWLALALILAACGAAIALAVRGRGRAITCAVVAVAAAAAWALTTPAFHVPDEPQHIAYAQYLAETGKLPQPRPGAVFSPEEGVTFGAVRFNHVFGNPTGRPPWQADEDRALLDALAKDPGRVPDGAFTNTTNNPPLYYALQVVPLKLADGGNFLDRLLAMRLVSVLLAGLTAAFVFLFLRELLPATPWVWPAGALVIAVQPLFGFVSGGVNNDAGIVAAGAAILWLVARVFRRGLDGRAAIGIGAALGLGLLMKATLAGLVPGLLVALAVVLARSTGDRARTLRLAALAAATAALPVIAYVLLNQTVWDRPLWSGVPGSDAATGGRPAQIREFLSYVWQFYLPRLPFMVELQSGLPVFNVWFKGLIGRYGWLDTTFPEWVYTVAVSLFGVVLALVARALWRARAVVSRRGGELLTYLVLVAGFLLLVGWAGYSGRIANGFIFEQTRYLLPLVALYAGLLAVAAKGAAPFGRPVAATFVVLACGHALFSLLLVVGRFYA